MRYLICLLGLLGLCAAGIVSGQEVKSQVKIPAVAEPREQVMLVIASQPDSPLQFEEAAAIRLVNGGADEVFRFRNRGTKPVRAYTIACWNTSNTGWIYGSPVLKPNDLLMPGQIWPRPEEGEELDLLPLTDELRAKLNLQPGPMRGILVLMFVRIEFSDGTTYSDETTFKALQDYMEKLDLKVN